MRRSIVAGTGLLCVAAIAGAWLAPRMLLAAWLAVWWWCLGLVLGCFTNAWMARLTGGAWGAVFQAASLRLRRTLPWLLLGAVPLLLGHARLYPWAGADPSWLHGHARPGFIAAWLSTPFFLARLALYALAWGWLTRPRSLVHKPAAAGALLLHGVLGSLAAVDLLMSLLPAWYSTAFGLVALSAQALSGAAVAVLFARGGPQQVRATAVGSVPLSRDLGNLLLMWVMTWAYLAFMQFLIIWAENLPREIAWYVPRLQTGWAPVGAVLVLAQLVLPFLALLQRSVKDQPRRLAALAAWLLLASMLDAAWMVLPSVDAHSLHGWWLLPALFGGASLLLAALLADPADAISVLPELRHAR